MDIVIVAPIQLSGDAMACSLKSRSDVTVLAVGQNSSLLRGLFDESYVNLRLINATQDTTGG